MTPLLLLRGRFEECNRTSKRALLLCGSRNAPRSLAAGPRVMHVSNILLDTQRWIQKHYPYWDRRGGADHIWMFSHDEGACWAPNAIGKSIWLTHWGRMGKNHT